jgi:hypothetical protein
MDDLDDDRFAPLTESELAAVPDFDDAAKDEGECVMPVPADAPPWPESHSKLGKPSATWTNRNAGGEPLFLVCRFEPVGGKSLWRAPSGALRWRWKAVPTPRPLLWPRQTCGQPRRVCGDLRG